MFVAGHPAFLVTRELLPFRPSQPIHIPLHRGFLALDGFDQLELRAAAVEVVAGAMGAKISVAAQKIRQEPHAKLESNELSRKGDVRLLRLSEKLAGGREIRSE